MKKVKKKSAIKKIKQQAYELIMCKEHDSVQLGPSFEKKMEKGREMLAKAGLPK